MAKNSKHTSTRIGRLASETLLDPSASQVAKSLAASALAQRKASKQTGADMEDLASRVLRSEKFSEDTKDLAASVLSQSNKAR